MKHRACERRREGFEWCDAPTRGILPDNKTVAAACFRSTIFAVLLWQFGRVPASGQYSGFRGCALGKGSAGRNVIFNGYSLRPKPPRAFIFIFIFIFYFLFFTLIRMI